MKSAKRADLLPNRDANRPQWGSLRRPRRRPAREKSVENPASAGPLFQPGNRFPRTRFSRHAAPSPTGIRGEPCLPLGWRLPATSFQPRPPPAQSPRQPPSPTPIPKAPTPTDWSVSRVAAACIKFGTRQSMTRYRSRRRSQRRKWTQPPLQGDGAAARAAKGESQ